MHHMMAHMMYMLLSLYEPQQRNDMKTLLSPRLVGFKLPLRQKGVQLLKHYFCVYKWVIDHMQQPPAYSQRLL